MGEIGDDRRRKIRDVAALGAGALLAIAASLAATAVRGGDGRVLPTPGPPAYWLVDRDAEAAYALDDRLILGLRIAVRRPLAVRATRDGGAWILGSGTGTAHGDRRLARISREGEIESELRFEAGSELAAVDGDDAIVLEQAGTPSSRLVRCGRSGEACILLEEPGITCAVLDASGLVLGADSGEVRRCSATGEDRGGAHSNLGGPIRALAAVGVGPDMFVLFGETRERIGLLAPDLEPRWIAQSGIAPSAGRRSVVAATADGEHAWLVDLDGPAIRRFSSEGALELELVDPRLLGSQSAVATEAGGLVVAASGALIRYDERGRSRSGQGGFSFLSGVDRISSIGPLP